MKGQTGAATRARRRQDRSQRSPRADHDGGRHTNDPPAEPRTSPPPSTWPATWASDWRLSTDAARPGRSRPGPRGDESLVDPLVEDAVAAAPAKGGQNRRPKRPAGCSDARRRCRPAGPWRPRRSQGKKSSQARSLGRPDRPRSPRMSAGPRSAARQGLGRARRSSVRTRPGRDHPSPGPRISDGAAPRTSDGAKVRRRSRPRASTATAGPLVISQAKATPSAARQERARSRSPASIAQIVRRPGPGSSPPHSRRHPRPGRPRQPPTYHGGGSPSASPSTRAPRPITMDAASTMIAGEFPRPDDQPASPTAKDHQAGQRVGDHQLVVGRQQARDPRSRARASSRT